MRLLKLEAQNVFSLGHVILDLSNRKLLLVTGYSNDDKNGNGAGKSSLANHAIVWGLFGQTYDGTRGDAVINRNSDNKFGKVEIDFESINGMRCKIIRTRNPNKLKLIEAGGLVETSRLEKEAQERINHLLGRDFQTFIHSDLIGPGTERSFFRLGAAEQVSVIENLLPINMLEGWAQTAKWRAKNIQESLRTLENERLQLNGKIEAVAKYMSSLEKKRLEWKINNETQINSQRALIGELREKWKETTRILDGLTSKVPNWAVEIHTLPGDIDIMKTAMTQLDVAAEYFNVMINSDTCNACLQLIAEEKKKEVTERLESNRTSHRQYALRWADLRDRYTICTTISDMNSTLMLQEEGMKIHEDLLNKYTEEKSPYDTEPAKEDIDKYKTKLSTLEQEIFHLQTELKWLEFWANGCSKDLRTMMIEEICPFLEVRINEYLKRLGNPQFKATVSTVKALKSGDIREKFNLDIKSDYGANSFDLLSVGEKQIVSFAASLAVADLATTQVAGRSNVLILDEPFMGLHKNNCDNIINFLNTCDVETILLISNEEALKELVPNRVHIVKTKGQSWLE